MTLARPDIRILGLLGAAMLLVAAGPPPGADACTGCHVKGGGVGVLQGRPAPDTMASLDGYRTGKLPATVMNRIVKGFTPEEMAALSNWFAGQ